MDAIRDLVIKAFAVDSIWSIIIRGIIWIVIAMIIIVSVDNPNYDVSSKKLKANLGFFTMFLLLSGGLIYLLFGIGAQ
ncbi:MAG: hypothetical protein UT13_C0001G0759 [Candidatus Pacebacteria bacterium GW2011_GWF2_38_9]|nr:MAG: hypothetical protein US01_C0001G0794 [candidate division TM6 bacterium GW2011_GWF2_28_16]KKQ08858.1 MAG: hypothetical protein US20_C0011G0027 [Candidatus Pacebacteria bacterium GW2011_GWF1_36_5]KKQ89111.1 MAG: hypothetical protein UT13_C0001G0759 [Candidatus Pacebacteria bacterium GW2011_GWF2_38_9]MBU1034060.1 hypothetical protein [Patescibacteria group bacterium]HAZ73611.1 hypothetical protein [Candidatus Paceibacterota bacterium]